MVTSSIFYSEGSSAGSRSFTVKPRQVSVPAYVQKVIFGSHIWFGMYEKIALKKIIKMTGPTRNNDSYNLMSVTVHLSLFFFIGL